MSSKTKAQADSAPRRSQRERQTPSRYGYDSASAGNNTAETARVGPRRVGRSKSRSETEPTDTEVARAASGTRGAATGRAGKRARGVTSGSGLAAALEASADVTDSGATAPAAGGVARKRARGAKPMSSATSAERSVTTSAATTGTTRAADRRNTSSAPPGVPDPAVMAAAAPASAPAADAAPASDTTIASEDGMSDLEAKWDAWLAAAPDLGLGDRPSRSHELDNEVKTLVLSDAKSKTLPALSGFERLWVHRRCGQLGLQSTSSGRGRGLNKDLTIAKPASWRMQWQGARALPPYVAPKQSARMDRLRRMERWRTRCDECGGELDAYNALYHWNGTGPMCQECIDALGLDGYKWEAKADFWD